MNVVSLIPTMQDFQFVPGNRMEWNLALAPDTDTEPDIPHTGEWRARIQIDGLCEDQKFIAASPEFTITPITNAFGNGTQFKLIMNGAFTAALAEAIRKGCGVKIIIEEGVEGNALMYFFQNLVIDSSDIRASL